MGVLKVKDANGNWVPIGVGQSGDLTDSRSPGIGAIAIGPTPTTLVTIDFGTATYPRTLIVCGSVIGSSVGGTSMLRLALALNGATFKQFQLANLAAGLTASCEINANLKVNANTACVLTLNGTNYGGAGITYNVTSDSTFSQLLATARPAY